MVLPALAGGGVILLGAEINEEGVRSSRASRK